MLSVLCAILGGLAVTSGLGVVLNRRALYSALSLVVNMLSLAVLFLLLSAQFIAVAQVIVYAGAVMVLFVFVIALLNPAADDRLSRSRRDTLLTATLGLLFTGVAAAAFLGATEAFGGANKLSPGKGFGGIEAVGHALYGGFAYPFEATGLVLVVAAVGAVYLSRGR